MKIPIKKGYFWHKTSEMYRIRDKIVNIFAGDEKGLDKRKIL